MKKLSIFLGVLAVIVVVLSLLTGNVYAVSIGDHLYSPETGWTRYETDTWSTYLSFTPTWNLYWDGVSSGGYTMYSSAQNASVSFTFTGTKLRIICAQNNFNGSTIGVNIDGSSSSFCTQAVPSPLYQILKYDSITLASGSHQVTLTNLGAVGSHIEIDAIDIIGTLNNPPSPTPTPTPSSNPSPTPSAQLCNDYSIEGSLGIYNPGTISANSQITQTYTAVGAQLGDLVQVSFNQDLQGITLYGYVSANNQVTVVFQNRTGNNITLNSGIIQIHTSRHTRS